MTIRKPLVLASIVAALGLLAWRLWPDAGRVRQQRGSDLLSAVASNRPTEVVRLLNEGADPNTQTPPVSFLLKAQVDYNYLRRGAKAPSWDTIDKMDTHMSVLQIAASDGHAEVVSALLSHGADVDYRCKGFRMRAIDLAKNKQVIMPPAAWKASGYPRIIAELEAADAQAHHARNTP